MFIIIKNNIFEYNKFVVHNLYVCDTIEEAREKAFEIIKNTYIEENENEKEKLEIIKYNEKEADITYDYEEAYTSNNYNSIFVTISKPTSC